MDIQKELNEWADWFIPHDSKDLRDALELNSFNQLNVDKLLAINGLSETYAFRAKDSWKAWQAAKAKANKQFESFIDQAIEDSACADERRSLQALLDEFQDLAHDRSTGASQ